MYFVSRASNFVYSKIQQFANLWSQYANINFSFTNADSANIRIAVDNDGTSWSYIGTGNLSVSQDKPTMNFGWFNDTTPDMEFSRVVVHEFGHALGCIHEQASPAAHIPWNKPVVYAWYLEPLGWNQAQVDSQVFAVVPQQGTWETLFDRFSIM